MHQPRQLNRYLRRCGSLLHRSIDTAQESFCPMLSKSCLPLTGSLLILRCQYVRPEWRGFDLDARVPREDHIAPMTKKVLVERECGGVVAETGRQVAVSGSDA